MNPTYEFEFIVGETYENEKGRFAVLSMGKEDMVIRWEHGEETKTSIEFQARIQKRRQWEKTMQQKKAEAAKPVPKKAKASRAKQPPPVAKENRPNGQPAAAGRSPDRMPRSGAIRGER